jgi:hypothetical protein
MVFDYTEKTANLKIGALTIDNMRKESDKNQAYFDGNILVLVLCSLFFLSNSAMVFLMKRDNLLSAFNINFKKGTSVEEEKDEDQGSSMKNDTKKSLLSK